MSVDIELLILSSFHGVFPHDCQVFDSKEKDQTTRLARILVMIKLVVKLEQRGKNMSTGYGEQLVTVLANLT